MGKQLRQAKVPFLSEAVAKLKAFGERLIDKVTEDKLSRSSASTIHRLLKEEKKKYELKGRSNTKPGTLLKNQIPIRTFAEWDEKKVGFLEIDLVGHEEGDPRGEFIQTLTAVDIFTDWTEIYAFKTRHRGGFLRQQMR